jgi:hypothetical protein
MIDDQRMTDILANWRIWQKRSNLNIGYPPKSLVFAGGGALAVGSDATYDVTQSEAYADADDAEARVVQAVVDDLPPVNRDAIYNVVMHTRRPLPIPLEECYLPGIEMLRARLIKRGIG